MKRRDFVKTAGIGSAALVSLPALPHALTRDARGRSPLEAGAGPGDTFIILLEGPYRPVVRCPSLGLLQVNVCDGSYSTTKIFAVSGLAEEDKEHGNRDRDGKKQTAIGDFYVQFVGSFAAYDLPGGALTMVFTAGELSPVPDGQGGTFLLGALDLDIIEATGVYQSFVGGHNKMVDILHQLADGTFVEHCYCIISHPQ
jgi:hypothetical protein